MNFDIYYAIYQTPPKNCASENLCQAMENIPQSQDSIGEICLSPALIEKPWVLVDKLFEELEDWYMKS